ncbi:F-actin capping protein, alpha subunit [Gyrodon lividus]|nr:F-actin capping protein, alpha subunit [Gyrodon lividus]
MSVSDERIEVAATFVLQSPPGEINDVLNDVRVIVDDDDTLEEGILPALRDYNLAQFIVVDVPGADHQTIVSDIARKLDGDEDEERFLDPRSKTSFKFDHLRLEASDSRPEEPDPEAEPLRAALETSAFSYLAAHYIDGVAAVFAVQAPNNFLVQIVSNKYNPSNFWSGRWRSHYEIDLGESRSIQGKVLVNVHYYEQGNVQLETSHDLSMSVPPAVAHAPPNTAASKIFALIEAAESRLQTSLNESYHEMSEKAFKGLRRTLPLTRQKIDWDKVLGYKLGAELTASKGAFATAS